MIKFIHIADLHLCDTFSNSIMDAHEIRSRQWESLKNVVSFANENACDCIFISGDLYEKKYFSHNHAVRLISILSKFNGYVLIIAGNHDYIGDSFAFDDVKIPDNIIIHVSNKVRRYDFDEYNLSVFMHSWEREIEYTPDLLNLQFKNKYNILMIHSGTNIDENYLPLKDSDINQEFQYIALGHIHKPMKIGERLFYPGSLEPLNIKETGKHGGYLVEMGEEINIEFIDFSLSQFFDEKIDCSDMTIEDVLDYCKKLKNDKTNVMRIRLIGENTFDSKELQYALKENFEYVRIVDDRDITMEFYGINSGFMDSINNIVDENYAHEYGNDLKRKIISIFNRVGRI